MFVRRIVGVAVDPVVGAGAAEGDGAAAVQSGGGSEPEVREIASRVKGERASVHDHAAGVQRGVVVDHEGAGIREAGDVNILAADGADDAVVGGGRGCRR